MIPSGWKLAAWLLAVYLLLGFLGQGLENYVDMQAGFQRDRGDMP